jgi:hypothetical protein
MVVHNDTAAAAHERDVVRVVLAGVQCYRDAFLLTFVLTFSIMYEIVKPRPVSFAFWRRRRSLI